MTSDPEKDAVGDAEQSARNDAAEQAGAAEESRAPDDTSDQSSEDVDARPETDDATESVVAEGADIEGKDSDLGQPAEAQPSGDADESEVQPLEGDAAVEEEEEEQEAVKQWYILKVQVNREESIRAALLRRVKIAGLEEYFEEVVVPTEDVAEFNKSGKRRIVKRKLYPGYIMVHLALNDDTWFLVRETPGIGDFTGSAGKPTAMEDHEVQRIIHVGKDAEAGDAQVKTAIPFKVGDRVRVKEGNFLNFEGEVSEIDEANGRVTVMINIFGRSTPVELEHWQIESV